MRKAIGAVVIAGLMGGGYLMMRVPAVVEDGASSTLAGAGALIAVAGGGEAVPVPRPAASAAAEVVEVVEVAAAPAAVPRAGLDAPGSEGYGPHVMRALESGSPKEAQQASWKLGRCADGSRGVDSILELRAKEADRRKAAIYSQMLEDEQAMLRACQTVTPEIAALRPRLRLKAALGGVFGEANVCLTHPDCKAIAGAEEATLRAARLADARQGDFNSIYGLLYDREHRVAGEERMVQVLAYRGIVQGGHEQGFEARLPEFEEGFRKVAREQASASMAGLFTEALIREFLDLFKDEMTAPLKLEGTPTPDAQRQADAIVAAYLQRKRKP